MRTTLKASLLGMSAAALLVGTALGAGPAHALTVTATVEDDQTVSGTMKNEHNGPANCNVALLKKSSLPKATAAVTAYEANNGVAWAQALSSMSDADAVGIAHKDAEAGESFDYTITPIAGGRADSYGVLATCEWGTPNISDPGLQLSDYGDMKAFEISRTGGGGGTSDPWGSLDGLFS